VSKLKLHGFKMGRTAQTHTPGTSNVFSKNQNQKTRGFIQKEEAHHTSI